MILPMTNTTNAGAIALSGWLKGRGIAPSTFAASNGLSPGSVLAWTRGEYLPGISNAVLVEKATDGAVQLKSWTQKVEG